MSQEDKKASWLVPIIVALIGLVGTLGAALIAKEPSPEISGAVSRGNGLSEGSLPNSSVVETTPTQSPNPKTSGDTLLPSQQEPVATPMPIQAETQPENNSSKFSLVGTWSGDIDQKNSSKDYSGKFTFYASNQSLSGESDYPELNCGGTLELISVNGSTYSFKETITSGKSKCTSGLTKVFFLTSPDSINYSTKNHPGTTGALRRTSN